MLVISCHADTGFKSHSLRSVGHGVVEGHLDNFAGVHSVMQAYFSGKLSQDHVRIELTYGEEVNFAGALEVLATLRPHDVVAVVDVTGTETKKDLCIEKCSSPELQVFLKKALRGMSFDLFEGCPDPISNSDEADVYRDKCPYTFFMGPPCWGGDYNAGQVRCRHRSLDALSEALCRISRQFPQFCKAVGIERL